MWSSGLGTNVLEERNIVSNFRIEVGFKPLNYTECEHHKSHILVERKRERESNFKNFTAD
jgi:hypothetical protein